MNKQDELIHSQVKETKMLITTGMKKKLYLIKVGTDRKPLKINQKQPLAICQTAFFCSVTRLGDLLDVGATFQSLWQQLICPNFPHSQAIFVKGSKSSIFLVKSFLGNFYRHLVMFFWSHCSSASFFILSLSLSCFWSQPLTKPFH